MVSQLATAGPVPTLNAMNALQHHAFNQLLAAWRRREDARQHGTLRDLADARVQLDSSRAAMRSTLEQVR